MELLFAQTPSQPSGNPLYSFIPLILIFVVFYFLLILPQQRRQRRHQQLLNALQKGDRIVTSSGIYGTVANIKDQVVSLVIADGVKIEIEKGHIAGKVDLRSAESVKK